VRVPGASSSWQLPRHDALTSNEVWGVRVIPTARAVHIALHRGGLRKHLGGVMHLVVEGGGQSAMARNM